jgi:hypothetical protein
MLLQSLPRKGGLNSEGLSTVGYSSFHLVILFSSGEVYKYLKVPYSKYLALLRADDRLQYFHNEIEGQHLRLRLPQAKRKTDDDEFLYPSKAATPLR